ncbi:MAG: hypothetical protein JWM27_3221 [Gemmatimonadetes bacterium]|nr:hypothetical protein [Gemmatimonadota bacterium]
MFDDAVPIVMFISVAFTIVAVTRQVSEGRTRRAVLRAGMTPEMAAAVLRTPREDPGLYGALKWGLVVGGVGLALVVAQFLPYRPDEPIVLGLVLLFGAAGLLVYHAAAKRSAAAAAAPGV